jgi:hypothetical protein
VASRFIDGALEDCESFLVTVLVTVRVQRLKVFSVTVVVCPPAGLATTVRVSVVVIGGLLSPISPPEETPTATAPTTMPSNAPRTATRDKTPFLDFKRA